MSWDRFPIDDTSDGIPVPESGMGFIRAWIAGPTLVFRRPASGEHRVEVTGPDGSTRSEPRSPTDQAEIDDLIDGVLLEAGLPARPAGFDWLLRVTETALRGMDSTANQILAERDAHHPAQWRSVLAESRGQWLSST